MKKIVQTAAAAVQKTKHTTMRVYATAFIKFYRYHHGGLFFFCLLDSTIKEGVNAIFRIQFDGRGDEYERVFGAGVEQQSLSRVRAKNK